MAGNKRVFGKASIDKGEIAFGQEADKENVEAGEKDILAPAESQNERKNKIAAKRFML